MKLVIDILDKDYEVIRNIEKLSSSFAVEGVKNFALSIIENATPLSESEDCISRQAALEALRTMYDTHIIETEDGDEYIDYNDTVYEMEQLPLVTPQPNRCNQCKYYEGVHNVQGHAPCSFLKCGGVLWDWYCSNYEPYKESEENGIN